MLRSTTTQFYRSYRTRLPCSPVIGNLAEHRPIVHSVSASCIPGKFLDNSEVVLLVVRILYNHEISRHKLRSAKKPCICMCVLCCFTLQKPNTNTLLETDHFYRKKLKYRSQTTVTWRNPFDVNKERNSRHNHHNQFNRHSHDTTTTTKTTNTTTTTTKTCNPSSPEPKYMFVLAYFERAVTIIHRSFPNSPKSD